MKWKSSSPRSLLSSRVRVGGVLRRSSAAVLLAPANATITAALRVLGLSDDSHFQNYHRVLNRARWSARQAAGILLRLLVQAFVPAGPVVIGLDDTVERRRGAKIKGRSMYRDAVRSSWGCFQKTSGLRWIGLHLITRIPWAKRTWALPFLTALAPSGGYPTYVQEGRRHKPLSERARGLIGQAQRWLPGRELIVVADGGYAVLDLLAWCQRLARPVTMISRLRMDGALYAPAPPRRPGQKGRTQVKGKRLPTPNQYLACSPTPNGAACWSTGTAVPDAGWKWPAARLCGTEEASHL